MKIPNYSWNKISLIINRYVWLILIFLPKSCNILVNCIKCTPMAIPFIPSSSCNENLFYSHRKPTTIYFSESRILYVHADTYLFGISVFLDSTALLTFTNFVDHSRIPDIEQNGFFVYVRPGKWFIIERKNVAGF